MKEIKTFEQRKEELLKKGKEKGVLTYEELAESLKGLELDADSLDELYNAFHDNNIEIISENFEDEDDSDDDGEEISIEEDLSSYCKQIDELSKEIIEYQNSILVLKQKKICSNCYMEIQNDAKYCPNCGAEQPKVNENETKIEKEETIEAEKADETEELKDSDQNN